MKFLKLPLHGQQESSRHLEIGRRLQEGVSLSLRSSKLFSISRLLMMMILLLLLLLILFTLDGVDFPECTRPLRVLCLIG